MVVKIKKELADECINTWYINTMEYYSAIKRNKIRSFVEMWMDLESVTQSGKQILYINAYMWNLERCTEEPICRAGIQMKT